MSEENNSETPSEIQKRASVYDFLYHDARRVGSFLSQFESHGMPGQIKASQSVGRVQTNRAQGGGQLGVPSIVQSQAMFEKSVSDDDKDSEEKTYDPFWTNAVRLLDFLSEKNLIERDIFSARMGQFILVSGSLIITDSKFLENSWERPAFKQQLRLSFDQQIKSLDTIEHKQKNDQFALFLEILKIIPHTIQCHLIDDKFCVWSCLSESFLVGTSTDLMLKSGALAPGIWNMLGVVDAFPAWALGPGPDGAKLDFDDMVMKQMVTPIATIVADLAPVARTFTGRPDSYFGVTPLLIFREVAGKIG